VPSVSISRPAALVLASLLLALLVIAGNRLAGAGAAGGAPEAVAPLEPVADEGAVGVGVGEIGASPSAREEVVVHVVGAVRKPGLLRLREGARVADAVARAGGATRAADLTAVNLAAPAVDGVQIFVPTRPAAVGAGGSGAAGGGGATGAGSASGSSGALAGAGVVGGRKLSLATATAEELDELPGVGPVTAQKILDYRAQHGPFRSVEDLDAVPGIGPARIEQLRDLVTP
jgi:competence protein ComEA